MPTSAPRCHIAFAKCEELFSRQGDLGTLGGAWGLVAVHSLLKRITVPSDLSNNLQQERCEPPGSLCLLRRDPLATERG